MAQEWSSVVHVNAGPWTVWPFPWVKGGSWGWCSMILASWTISDTVFNGWVHSWPHTKLRASAFILVLPGWPSCNCLRMISCPFDGMTTLASHNTQPFKTDNSALLFTYGISLESSSQSDQPLWMKCQTQDRTGSVSVHCLMWEAVTSI